MFSGCITALITPFENGRVNIDGLKKNILFQLQNGVKGVLACGSTGEAPTLTELEWEAVISTTVATARGKVVVAAGAGTNSTDKSIKQIRRAEELGVDAVLVVAPYYNKPTQDGLYRHFRACAEATRLPVIIYNIPPRSVINIAPHTIEKLVRDCENIVAIKEASGNLDQCTEILIRCADRVSLLSGDDSLTLPILAVGGKGVISVVSNVVPRDVQQMVDEYLRGRIENARKIHQKLFPLIKALFVESNPIPVKAAMNILGMSAGDPRLPLVSLSQQSLPFLLEALKNYGLLG